MATWPSGKAGACKALTTGSNPVVASIASFKRPLRGASLSSETAFSKKRGR
jgi:hypothetical protein